MESNPRDQEWNDIQNRLRGKKLCGLFEAFEEQDNPLEIYDKSKLVMADSDRSNWILGSNLVERSGQAFIEEIECSMKNSSSKYPALDVIRKKEKAEVNALLLNIPEPRREEIYMQINKEKAEEKREKTEQMKKDS